VFLQDLTIAFGRRSLKGLRYKYPTLEFNVAEEEVNGAVCERLNIEARTETGGMMKVSIWEDAIAWVYYAERGGKASRPRAFELYASLAEMDVEEVARLLRTTLVDWESAKQVWEQRSLSEGRG